MTYDTIGDSAVSERNDAQLQALCRQLCRTPDPPIVPVIHYPCAGADAMIGDLLRDHARCFDDEERAQLAQRLKGGFADEPDGPPLGKRRTQNVKRRTAFIDMALHTSTTRSALYVLRFLGLPWQWVDAEALLDDRELTHVPTTEYETGLPCLDQAAKAICASQQPNRSRR